MGVSTDRTGLQIGSVQVGWKEVGLLGRSRHKGIRGEVVCERLGTFVSPALEDGPDDLPYGEWVQYHNDKVRGSLRGSANIGKRLNGEAEEAEKERPKERVLKGEALMVKLLEQRMRRGAKAQRG
jgi:hypothetical protein